MFHLAHGKIHVPGVAMMKKDMIEHALTQIRPHQLATDKLHPVQHAIRKIHVRQVTILESYIRELSPTKPTLAEDHVIEHAMTQTQVRHARTRDRFLAEKPLADFLFR